MPLADWPIFGYGNQMAGGFNSGIFLYSVAQRLPLLGSCGRGPMFGAAVYHLLPSGWPTNFLYSRCLRQQAPFHGPWLSVKKTSPAALKPMPPGERSPLVHGVTLPSWPMRRHQPRNLFWLVNEPVRHRATNM